MSVMLIYPTIPSLALDKFSFLPQMADWWVTLFSIDKYPTPKDTKFYK